MRLLEDTADHTDVGMGPCTRVAMENQGVSSEPTHSGSTWVHLIIQRAISKESAAGAGGAAKHHGDSTVWVYDWYWEQNTGWLDQWGFDNPLYNS